MAQRCVSLLAGLLMQLPPGGRGGVRRERVLSKFVENEFEKTDRLMELLFGWGGWRLALHAWALQGEWSGRMLCSVLSGLGGMSVCVARRGRRLRPATPPQNPRPRPSTLADFRIRLLSHLQLPDPRPRGGGSAAGSSGGGRGGRAGAAVWGVACGSRI